MSDRGKVVSGIVVVLVLLISISAWFAFKRDSPPLAAAGAESGGAAASPTGLVAANATPSAAATTAPEASGANASADAAASQGPSGQTPVSAAARTTATPADEHPAPAAAFAAPTATAQANGPEPQPEGGVFLAAAQVDAAAAPIPAPGQGGAVTGRFQNRVGNNFKLLRMTVTIDGAVAYSGAAPAEHMFDRQLAPGNHAVSVVADYQGSGGSLFSYMEGYRFQVRSGKPFATRAQTPSQVTITAYERGGPTDKFEDRLAIGIDAR